MRFKKRSLLLKNCPFKFFMAYMPLYKAKNLLFYSLLSVFVQGCYFGLWLF